MVGYHPVIKDIEEEGGGEDDDRHQVKKSRILQNHFQSVPDGGVLLVNLIFSLVQLQSVD